MLERLGGVGMGECNMYGFKYFKLDIDIKNKWRSEPFSYRNEV